MLHLPAALISWFQQQICFRNLKRDGFLTPFRRVTGVHRPTAASALLSSHGRLPPHDRRGVRDEDNRGERPEDQAADLGHGGSRAFQGRHPLLLPRGCRSAHGLRHHEVRAASCVCVSLCSPPLTSDLVAQEKHVQPPQQLADRRQKPHQPKYCKCHRNRSLCTPPS